MSNLSNDLLFRFRSMSVNLISKRSFRCQGYCVWCSRSYGHLQQCLRLESKSNQYIRPYFSGPHESRLSHTIDSCLVYQWKSILMVNRSYNISESQKLQSLKSRSTLYPVDIHKGRSIGYTRESMVNRLHNRSESQKLQNLKSQSAVYSVIIPKGRLTGYTWEVRALTPRSTSSTEYPVDIVARMLIRYTCKPSQSFGRQCLVLEILSRARLTSWPKCWPGTLDF